MAKPEPSLSTDHPQVDPTKDQLGYAPFAKALANSIVRMSPPDGLVIGLFGAWGLGKTTVLNFIEHYLKADKAAAPVIIRFNPWWFAGHEDLARKFVHQLRVNFEKEALVGEKLGNLLGSLGDLISEIPWEGAGAIGKVLGMARTPEKDFTELKESIEQLLRDQPRRIVIIIDDIDRLSAEEVRQVFRVIKAVANFPNVTYILAFDREAVSRALDKFQEGKGEDYLEKIIQVSFEMPHPDKDAMRGLLLTALDEISKGTPEELLDREAWANLYYDGIERLFDTPRDIVRYANTLRVTYPAVRGEVAAADFFAIEAIRLFQPELYATIRQNRSHFAGAADTMGLRDPKEHGPFHEEWKKRVKLELQEPVVDVVKRLFPRTEAAMGGSYYGASWSARWRKEARIADPEHFTIFFRFALPASAISRARLKELADAIPDERKFTLLLREMLREKTPQGQSLARVALDRLHDFTAELKPSDATTLAAVLLDIGDELDTDSDRGRSYFDPGNDMFTLRLIYRGIEALPPAERAALILDRAQHATAIGTMSHLAFYLAAEHGRYGRDGQPEDKRTIDAETLAKLDAAIATRLRTTLTDPRSLDVRNFPMMLHMASTILGADAARELAKAATTSDSDLVQFLQRYLSWPSTQTAGDKFARTGVRLRPESVERYLGENLRERARTIAAQPNLTPDARLTLETYLQEVESLKKGVDPDALDEALGVRAKRSQKADESGGVAQDETSTPAGPADRPEEEDQEK